MRIGLKRTFFPLRMFFPIIALAIIATLIYGSYFKSSNEAAAQIAVLYSSTCLGGWKNPDLATGIPEVIGDTQATYSDNNSATLSNTMTQLFCAGFAGEIPKDADRTKISVRFSWQMEGHEAFQKETIQNDEPEYRTEIIPVTESGSSTEGTTEPGATDDSAPADTPAPSVDTSTEPATEEQPAEPEPAAEEPAAEPEPETVSWWQWLMPFAYAQEETPLPLVEEVVSEPAPEVVIEEPVTTPEEVVAEDEGTAETNTTPLLAASSTDPLTNTATTASSSVTYGFVSPVFDQDKDKENALFEVLFTIDNTQWHSLGYVSRINNDISFELPIHLFPTIEDFSKLQISLESVERIDDTPKIYLDSMWVEVSYTGAGEDPLTPPGALPGDMITNTYKVDDRELVTVFRNVSLETISNILMLTTSSSAATSSTSSSTVSVAEVASSTITVPETSTGTTTSTSSIVIYDAPISLETKQILRETPGVVVELWLHNLTEDTWMRVADNTSVATLPRAVLIETKVFWFGPFNSSVWVFDSLSQGYASQSITPQERVSVDYVDSTGVSQTVWFNPESEMLELLVSDE